MFEALPASNLIRKTHLKAWRGGRRVGEKRCGNASFDLPNSVEHRLFTYAFNTRRGNNTLISKIKALTSSGPTLVVHSLLLPWLAVYEPRRPDVIEEGIKFSEPLLFYKQQMERTFINSKV